MTIHEHPKWYTVQGRMHTWNSSGLTPTSKTVHIPVTEWVSYKVKSWAGRWWKVRSKRTGPTQDHAYTPSPYQPKPFVFHDTSPNPDPKAKYLTADEVCAKVKDMWAWEAIELTAAYNIDQACDRSRFTLTEPWEGDRFNRKSERPPILMAEFFAPIDTSKCHVPRPGWSRAHFYIQSQPIA